MAIVTSNPSLLNSHKINHIDSSIALYNPRTYEVVAEA
jgi:hypothetical protein